MTGMVTRLSLSSPDQLARPRLVADPVMAWKDGVVGSVARNGADIFGLQMGIKVLV